MRKRIISTIMISIMAVSLVGCGNSSDSSSADNSASVEESSAEGDVADRYSGTYINLDEMNIYLDGVKYTIGKSTMGEMLENGVNLASNNVEGFEGTIPANTEITSAYKIDADDAGTVLCDFGNNTDEEIPTTECTLRCVSFDIRHLKDADDNIIGFDFPLDITTDEFIENAGEPTENKVNGEGVETQGVRKTTTLKYDKVEGNKEYMEAMTFGEEGIESVTLAIITR